MVAGRQEWKAADWCWQGFSLKSSGATNGCRRLSLLCATLSILLFGLGTPACTLAQEPSAVDSQQEQSRPVPAKSKRSDLLGQSPAGAGKVLHSAPLLSNSGEGESPQTTKVPARLATFATPLGSSVDMATPDVLAWLEKLIRANLPPSYEDDRKWGKQKEVWDGIQFRREGLKVETKRKKKMVNAGTWTKYRVSFVEPEKNLQIQFQRLEALPDGRVAFSVVVDCSLDVFGRLSQWVRDVQVISLSANADAACRLTISGAVQFRVNPLQFPPQVSLHPKVEEANVELTYYRVRRISQLGGDFAKVLGQGLRKVLDDKIEEYNGKLVSKINTQMAKHEEKLSFSAQDWLSKKLSGPSKAN
ncbi:MAG: hypothetical protein AAGG44_01955 [Planctomycetota bacterium]